MNYKDDLWDILEKFSETRLFRDWNDPRVNELLHDFERDLLELHVHYRPDLYTVTKS